MQGVDATIDGGSKARRPAHRLGLVKPMLGLVATAGLAAWIAQDRFNAAPQVAALAVETPAPRLAPALKPAAAPAPNPFGDLIDISNLPMAALVALTPPARQVEAIASPPQSPARAQSVPLPPVRDSEAVVWSAPLPPTRPAEIADLAEPLAPAPALAPAAPARHAPLASVAATHPAAVANEGNIFQRLFAASPPIASAAAAARASALPGGPAAPADSSSASSAWSFDRYTAIYDISARSVILPDGTQLEAHSGLGDGLDNPNRVSERMRGPTPPHAYELTPREALFHGVAALRLNPIGGGALYGRAGLLAHSFMMGPNGDSNGCISIRDYEAFLRAYKSGQVKRVVVVARR